MWNIRCYRSESGRNKIEEWYKDQSASVQAGFDSALSHLVAQPRSAWIRPSASKLVAKNCANLFEIRFFSDRKQIRPLGYFGPIEASEFTILFCAMEKGNDFVPKNACEQANNRKKNVDFDRDKYSCMCFCNGVGFACCESS